MKRIFLVILALVSVPLHAQKTLGDGIKELAMQITANAAKQEKQRIAVLPFHELDGQPTVLGTYLAEELVTNLFELGNFKIVERQLLDKVMGELKVQRSGAIDPSTAKEIGRITAADAIVTGSITELESSVAVNCRLIDTTTGEVFGAARTKITKDDDVTKIMNRMLAHGDDPASGTRTSYQTAKAIAAKDIGSLRVVLKSVLPMKVSDWNGQRTSGIRWTFEFTNREARRPMVVALNAEPSRSAPSRSNPTASSRSGASIRNDGAESQNRYSPGVTLLRSSVLDDRGGVWKLSSGDLGSIGFVRTGVHGPSGRDAYSASEVVRLLLLRDELGRGTDDPSDGISVSADGWTRSDGSGAKKFSPFEGNTFISGSTTTIEPGQSVTVTMSFYQERGTTSGSPPTFFQFNSEMVIGVVEAGTRKSYSLHSLTFDRVSVATF